jgi:hypothetical protein
VALYYRIHNAAQAQFTDLAGAVFDFRADRFNGVHSLGGRAEILA